MSIDTVAILSPGDMGHAVGQLLRERGLWVVTYLSGRSPRTHMLSEKAGIIDMPSLEDMVSACNVVLSITVSKAVPEVSRRVASAIRATESDLLFAECNAISPQMAREMEAIVSGAGARFVDVSIVGGPPAGDYSPRFYASGAFAAEFEELREFGLDVRNIGPKIGQASGIKMCYAAMTKGSAALYAQLLLAAESMGLSEHLATEFQGSQAEVYRRMESYVPGVPARARRWISEMEEIEATFEHLGLTPHLFRGVADMYRFIGGTELGNEHPETANLDRTLRETIQQLAANLAPSSDVG